MKDPILYYWQTVVQPEKEKARLKELSEKKKSEDTKEKLSTNGKD